MKVLFVFGGLPHYFNKVMNTINSYSMIDVVVIAPSEKGMTIGNGVFETEHGIEFKVVRLKEYITWYGKPFFKNYFETIKSEKPDIIVIGWPYFLSFVFMPVLLIRHKLLNIKLFAKEIPFTTPAFNETWQDFSNRCVDGQKNEKIFRSKSTYFFLKLIRKYLYTIVFHKALLYIESGIEIIHSYGLKKKNIIVTYNSPDTDDIFETIKITKEKNPNLEKNPYRIIHIGRLVKWKNVHLLIEAIDALKFKYENIELIVIGKGEEEENLINQVKKFNLGKYVSFLGALYEGEEQSKEFLKSGVYALAGMGGLSINEAMAHSLPIICSVADGTEKHLVFDGYNGFYFKDSDLGSLCDAIEKVFSSDITTMGKNSLSIIENKINIKNISTIYCNAFLSK